MTTFDAWGGLFTDWELTWTYTVPDQPVTSAGHGAGHGASQRGARGRFFPYPNIIDDGNLLGLPVSPALKPRQVKKARRPSVEVIDEDDPDIQRMRQAMERRVHADEPPPSGDDDLKRIYRWLQKRK